MSKAKHIKKLVIPEGWEKSSKGISIKRTLLFKDFLSAFLFVARITVHAEVLSHHPDIKLTYGKVAITLTTHSEKSLTQKDINLAKRINQSYDNSQHE